MTIGEMFVLYRDHRILEQICEVDGCENAATAYIAYRQNILLCAGHADELAARGMQDWRMPIDSKHPPVTQDPLDPPMVFRSPHLARPLGYIV